MSKSIIILLSILGALTVTAVIYFGYMYFNELISSNGSSQNNVVNTDNKSSNQEDVSKLDNEINNIVNSIDSDKTEVDFEDFDSELELGL